MALGYSIGEFRQWSVLLTVEGSHHGYLGEIFISAMLAAWETTCHRPFTFRPVLFRQLGQFFMVAAH